MSRRRAFTLVELLVVIGIIALLISILLPALNRARESAWRVVCLAGMRELGHSLRLYSTEFNDSVPIGYMDQHNFSFFVNWNNVNGTKITMMGFLAEAGMMPSPQAFYCPAVKQDPRFMYDTPENPWPFHDYPNHPRFTTPGLGHTRITYMTRPIANWPTNNIPWASGPDSAGYRFPYLGTNWTAKFSNPSGAGLEITMPKFSKLKNKAILTELIVSHHDVLRTHRTGINVYYANGSGQWVDLTKWVTQPIPFGAPLWSEQDVWRKWRSIPDGSGAYGDPNTYNDYFLVEREHYGGPTGHTIQPHLLPTGVWINLDNTSR
jgi:prepilin-type N-terminal cleavage/methylation domain-containing protein